MGNGLGNGTLKGHGESRSEPAGFVVQLGAIFAFRSFEWYIFKQFEAESLARDDPVPIMDPSPAMIILCDRPQFTRIDRP